MAFTHASSALKKYLVLDLTRARSGPTAVRQLADFGARVIKIEEPGDPNNAEMGSRHGPDFQNLHRNKQAITLNLKDPRGKEIFMKMAAKADVIVENYRPGVKHKLGIDYDAVRKVNPRIVYASISGFGQTGPYAERPGLDQVAQGMGGHMAVTGHKGGGPVRSGAAISDMTAGMLTAGGIMAALLERESSGEGQWLHTSLLQAQIYLLDFQSARWLVDQDIPGQEGNEHPTNVPTGCFPTKDGWVNIAPLGTEMFVRLAADLGFPEAASDEKFKTPAARRKNRAELWDMIAAATKTKTTSEWVELLNNDRIPCGPIYTMDQVFDDPQVKHLAVAQEIETKKRGKIKIVGQPVTLARTPTRMAMPTPELSEHTDEVLAEFGYGKDAIESFHKERVV
jgi:crotonobetainyl-CoA:carnitine CoA-transferase CaiB-like acyl-CoA transferase